MIKIDDDLSASFTGSNDTITYQYSRLTMLLLRAKMTFGTPFQRAVEEIIMAVETAVDFHVLLNNQELDWEKIKKFHALDRLLGSAAAADLMYDDDTNEDEEVEE